MKPLSRISRGYFTLVVLIASSVFLYLLASLMNSVIATERTQAGAGYLAQAFASAEAGLEYYRWHLGRFPDDFSDGTVGSGPFTHAIVDDGQPAGAFSLSVVPDTYCGETASVAITSVGTSPVAGFSKTLFARYAKPTVAVSASPAPSSIDFSAISASLPTLKEYAVASGIDIAPSGAYGYKLVFTPGSVAVYPVTAAEPVWGYSSQGWRQEDSVISSLGPSVTYGIPAACPLVFVEDQAWIEGVVSGRVAVVSANVSGSGPSMDVFLSNDLSYADPKTDGLTVIGQRNVLIDLQSPDLLTLQGVFVAAGGMFGREEYLADGAHAVPAALSADVLRTGLSVYGTVVSSEPVVTRWSDESGDFVSGYGGSSLVPDEALGKRPPPFSPVTSTIPRFIDWEQRD